MKRDIWQNVQIIEPTSPQHWQVHHLTRINPGQKICLPKNWSCCQRNLNHEQTVHPEHVRHMAWHTNLYWLYINLLLANPCPATIAKHKGDKEGLCCPIHKNGLLSGLHLTQISKQSIFTQSTSEIHNTRCSSLYCTRTKFSL